MTFTFTGAIDDSSLAKSSYVPAAEGDSGINKELVFYVKTRFYFYLGAHRLVFSRIHTVLQLFVVDKSDTRTIFDVQEVSKAFQNQIKLHPFQECLYMFFYRF